MFFIFDFVYISSYMCFLLFLCISFVFRRKSRTQRIKLREGFYFLFLHSSSSR